MNFMGVLIVLLIAYWIVSKFKKTADKFEQREIAKQKRIQQANAKAEKERIKKLDEEIRRLDEDIEYYEHGEYEEEEEE